MTWSPLACGLLTGKYDDGVPLHSRASLKVRDMHEKCNDDEIMIMSDFLGLWMAERQDFK
jgi:aryl-alcohol dehydrogenase-like predicted oxidoreductase